MSTLKKILSLSLALAMLMSVSVFADFADQAEIDKDAVASVNKLTTVKILNGIENEDGTYDFNPSGTIKRGEAAKMIYVLRNGGTDDKAVNWVKETASFADTDGHWAEGYIEYCKTYGIINGRTTTSFDPEAPVTGIELAKMLLVTIGYKAEVEGYTGNNYADAVLQRANEVGLFEGTKFAISTAAPRQWAAVMFDNALDVIVPTYIGDYLVTGAIGTVQQSITVSAKYLGIDYATDVVVANDSWALAGSKADSGYVTFKTLAKADGSKTFEFDVANDMVGQQVTVAYKVDANGYASEIFGVTATGKTIVSDITTSKNSSGTYYITFNGVEKSVSTSNVGSPTPVKFSASAADDKIRLTSTTGVELIKEIYDDVQSKNTAAAKIYGIDVDGNGKLDNSDYIVVNETLYGTVSDFVTAAYSDSTATAFKVGNLTVQKKHLTKTVIAENIEKDGQIVKVAYDHKTGKSTITLADTAVGSFTAIAGSEYTIGGTKYKLAQYPMTADANNFLVQGNLAKIAQLYTDGKYVIMAREFESNEIGAMTDKLALLIDGYYDNTATKFDELGRPDGTTEVYKVKVLLASGATAVFEYETKVENLKTSDLKVATLFTGNALTQSYVGGIYEYSIGSNGKLVLKTGLSAAEDVKYHMSNLDHEGTGTTVPASSSSFGMEAIYLASSKLLKAKSDDSTLPIQVTDDTLVFAKYTEADGDVVYKVVKMSSFTENKPMILYASTGTGIKTALLGRMEYTESAQTDSTPYVYVTTDATTAVGTDGKVYAYFTGFDLQTGKVVNYTAEKTMFGNVSKNKIYAIEVTDGVVTKADEKNTTNSDWNEGSVTAKVDGMYIIDNVLYQTSGTEKGFTSSAKIYVKDGTTFTAKTLADITVALKDSSNNSYANIKYVLDGGKIAYVIYTANQKGF